jgi:hypothetical protein
MKRVPPAGFIVLVPSAWHTPIWLAVLALCLLQFVDVLGVTVVVTALPARCFSPGGIAHTRPMGTVMAIGTLREYLKGEPL